MIKWWGVTQPLQLLHKDIWGPFKYPTRSNCKMFITIVDDFSRMSWIFQIKCKSEIPKIFMHFVNLVENQLSLKVKVIRTDNADQLTKGEALKFYLTHGIRQQTNCTDTPQRNGVVERKQRHILETARCLFFNQIPNEILGRLHSMCSAPNK